MMTISISITVPVINQSSIVNPKGLVQSLGLTLLLLFTLLTSLNNVHGNPVHQLDDHSSCSSYCGDHYHSLNDWTSCARGCRFFSLIQILAKPQSLDAIEKSCITTCNETYNEIQLRKSCSSGCRKSTEMINSSKSGQSNTDHHLHSSEQWIHHLGISPFEETIESQHRELIWPFHFFNDIYKQLTDQLSSSSNWIKSRSSYTLLFGDSSNGRQIFLVRARPHLTIDPTSSSLSHSSLSINPIHEQSTFRVIAFPSSSPSSSSSSSHLNKPIKISSSTSSSSSIVSPLSHNYQTDQSQTFTRWVSDKSSTVFKDLRLLMALLLAIVVLSIVTFSEALCWTADGRNKDNLTPPTEIETNDQEKSDPSGTSPFFILNSSKQSKEAEANGSTTEEVKTDQIIEAESEQPPTYDETIKTSALNLESLVSSRESKA